MNYSTLKKLNVCTQSGTKLGHINELELKIDTLSLSKISVRHNLLGSTLLIARSQIIEITKTEIIVRDNVIEVPVKDSKVVEAVKSEVVGAID